MKAAKDFNRNDRIIEEKSYKTEALTTRDLKTLLLEEASVTDIAQTY